MTRTAWRCADVWVYSLLHCELTEGHHPPHMAAAPGDPACRTVGEGRPRPSACIARAGYRPAARLD